MRGQACSGVFVLRHGDQHRLIEVVRGVWGVLLLVRPHLVLGRAAVRSDHRAVVVTRILGARHLTQAAMSGLRPSPPVLAMGVWVDTVHAGSAVALGASDRSRARAGLLDAIVAALWAMAGRRDLRFRAQLTRPAHRRRRDRLASTVLAVVPGGRSLLRETTIAERNN